MEIQRELNRLAGTTGLDAQAAANDWAGTTQKDLLGALNAKNSSSGLGLNAVCNAIAGTSKKEAKAALESIA